MVTTTTNDFSIMLCNVFQANRENSTIKCEKSSNSEITETMTEGYQIGKFSLKASLGLG